VSYKTINTFNLDLAFSNIVFKGVHLLLSTALNLNAPWVKSHLVVLDNRLANQNTPLDNTTIYPKLDQALLYSSLNWWNEMAYKYTFALHVLFHLCQWCHTSIQPPPSSNDEQWSSICVTNYANHKTHPPSIHLKSTKVLTLVWSPWNDMIHFIASHSLICPSII
jgi:hypothetical protein